MFLNKEAREVVVCLSFRHLVGLFLDLDSCDILKSLHAQTDLAVFDADDLDLDGLSFFEHDTRVLDSLLADLGYVYESGQIVGETDKRTVWHQRFHRSLGHEADFYIRYALLAFFCFFLAQDLFCGEHELFSSSGSAVMTRTSISFADPVLRIFYIFQSQLGGRDKAADALLHKRLRRF